MDKTSARGKFIVFEGIDGSGKSSQVEILRERLNKLGEECYTTCEPSNRPIGKMIRQCMSRELEMHDKVIAGLFVADRLDHLLNNEDGICKKLENGIDVITDRYYFSSYAYHGVHMDLDWVIAANGLSKNILKPDINIFIDIDPEISLERINKRAGEIELYENLENMKKVREKYLEAFKKQETEENIVIINGNQSVEKVSNDIWNVVKEHYNIIE